ncbi:hypothetical protein LX64_05026 [Chitinophaga skermanii]|uniref:Uncharacterized protein n=1 Tax=Chitinophaga skermanii TaxID=331697 RepID=A0A327Q3G5_9BACT|nr:hypothetical protein [Chitinophaga skermanii]RAI97722.1 hypothetical protein LX64_05026 [Chitinophaga skermanii]
MENNTEMQFFRVKLSTKDVMLITGLKDRAVRKLMSKIKQQKSKTSFVTVFDICKELEISLEEVVNVYLKAHRN